MDYNDFELVMFWVLSSAPALVLIGCGIFLHIRRTRDWMSLYLVLGILACFPYALFAGGLIAHLFPPPYVPGLSEGRGLDLRGVGFIVGSWLGAIAGAVAALLTVAGCRFQEFLRGRARQNRAVSSAPPS